MRSHLGPQHDTPAALHRPLPAQCDHGQPEITAPSRAPQFLGELLVKRLAVIVNFALPLAPIAA